MALEKKILSVTEPKILIDQITMMDTDDPKQPINSTEKEFKKAQKWMSEVVGRTYEDYLKLQIQQQEVKSDG